MSESVGQVAEVEEKTDAQPQVEPKVDPQSMVEPKVEPNVHQQKKGQKQGQQKGQQKGQQQGQKNKNKQKKGGKKANTGPSFQSEGDRLVKAILDNKTEFYVFDFDLDDDTDQVPLAVEHAKNKLTDPTAFLAISVGAKKLTALVSVHPDLGERVSAKTWLAASLVGLNGDLTDDSTDLQAMCLLELDTAFKFKDVVRGNAFAYLRKNKLLVEEDDSEEEMYDF